MAKPSGVTRKLNRITTELIEMVGNDHVRAPLVLEPILAGLLEQEPPDLPDAGGPTNRARAEWAEAAAEVFADQTGQAFRCEDGEDALDTIRDLITDLCHLLAHYNANVANELALAIAMHGTDVANEKYLLDAGDLVHVTCPGCKRKVVVQPDSIAGEDNCADCGDALPAPEKK